MWPSLCLFALLAVTNILAQPQQAQQNQFLHRKFEYKHSFRAPKLAQPDGSIPFWEIMGDAIASPEQLRLVPSMRSRRGAVWNKKQFTASENFEVEMTMKVTGQGRIGADGLAFWYTSYKGSVGPVFGSNDYWTGMGILFDSFDNDNQKNNPYISLMINDGTRAFNHQTDGSGQSLAGCQKDFRNRPYPVKVRVQYYRNVVTVMIHDGMTQHDRFEICLRAENIVLPKNGWFGLSANTGGLADDHDIMAFSTVSISHEQPAAPARAPPEQDLRKAEEEYERQIKQFQEDKTKFQEAHPDKARGQDIDNLAQFMEDTTTRELRLLLESQEAIRQMMATLDGKLNSLTQHSTQILTQVNRVGTAPVAQGQVHTGQGQVAIDTFNRNEVTEVLNTIRDIQTNIRDMRTYVNEVYTRSINMENKLNNMPQGQGVASIEPAQGQAGGVHTPTEFTLNQIKNYVEGIKLDVESLRANPNAHKMGQGPSSLTACPTCLGSTAFYMVIAVQTCIIVMLLIFKKGQDKAKFY